MPVLTAIVFSEQQDLVNHNVIICRRRSQCNHLQKGISMKSSVEGNHNVFVIGPIWNHNAILCGRESQCYPLYKGVTMSAFVVGDHNEMLCRRESQCNPL